MNREQKRIAFQKFKRLTPDQFWRQMNVLHSRAYGLAQKHYEEAMDIVLTPKQKAAVVKKAHEIRELWDGVFEVTTSETEAEFFRSINEEGLTR
ncbi:hypothetical protein [Corallococcus carmarthensis]|jgi:Spy/CpxP family protein refolding chaperone|uniref:hypothetical protein n=1 Tax=Corallococcus carmarthensis TaxID=2316728 RepID=UPI00148B7840|nr:hypothetical protein [Corallococcus carmarthensis]NOK23845.1 hypothetical protein [Corallococcus carmarthensis]